MHSDLIALISRNIYGWQYQFVPSIKHDMVATSTHSGYPTKKEVERKARMHAAQILCKIPDDSCQELITNAEDMKDHLCWFAWQVRYKQFKEQGLTNTEAHYKASNFDVSASVTNTCM